MGETGIYPTSKFNYVQVKTNVLVYVLFDRNVLTELIIRLIRS